MTEPAVFQRGQDHGRYQRDVFDGVFGAPDSKSGKFRLGHPQSFAKMDFLPFRRVRCLFLYRIFLPGFSHGIYLIIQVWTIRKV